MLPEGWEYANLGGITSHRKGHPFKSNTYKTHGTRVIRISDTTSNSIHSLNPVFIENNGSENLDEFALKHGDIILTTVGSKPHLIDSMVGKAVRIPDEIDGALLNQNLVKLSPNDKFIISDILFLYLKSRNFISYISDLVRGNANQVSISLKDIFAYRVLLPPLPEQKKIAAILSTWDRAIEGTEKLLANSQQQKKALMQQLLTGKKRLPRFSGEWKKHRLSDCCHVVMGSSPKSEFYNETGEGLPLLQGNADIKNRLSCPRIFTSEITKECQLGDILLSVRAPVGTVSIALHHACIGRGISSIRAKKGNSQDFAYQYFLSIENCWERLAQGSTFEAVNGDDIKKLTILLPSFPEQKAIAAVLTTADEEITALESDLTRLRQEKKALMQQLLTGKRRVTVN